MSADLDDRTQFLGGSDIPAILGLSRYKTPLSVWAEKTGQIQAKDEPSLAKKLGKRLEEVVAELWMEDTGKRLIRANERRVHPKYPYLRAQIDRLVVDEDATWEGKTTSVWLRKDWQDDEVPQEAICQAMWGLAVTGKKHTYVAGLIGNQDFKWKKIDRDPVLIAEMVKRATSFWNDFIVPKVMPGQITAADADTLLGLFPSAEVGKEIDLGDDANQIIESRNAMIQDRIALERQIDQSENRLKAMLQDAEMGVTSLWKVAWRNQTRKGYTVEPKTFRRFDIREMKGEHHG